MREKHVVKMIIPCRCPKESCGFEFDKKLNVEFVTNSKGDLIEYKTLNQ